MIISILILLFNIYGVILYRYQKPLEQKIWSERCKRNSVVLNDCNWCWCDANQRYQCKARICEDVDMFGHFKDAIQDINVGMEGHGAWRSKVTPCEPGINYERNGVLCVCDDDGYWPNPVCRDLFRVLHSVKVTNRVKLAKNETCETSKFYLVGCNVCVCPFSGFLNQELCTDKTCVEGDPVLEEQDNPQITANIEERDLEVYAVCDPNYKYQLDEMKCDCLRNNRLICSDPADVYDSLRVLDLSPNSLYTFCKGRSVNEIFNIDCNFCYCDRLQDMYCTTRRCISKVDNKTLSILRRFYTSRFKWDTAPIDDEYCRPGTKYKRDCNICGCVKRNQFYVFVCTMKICSKLNQLEHQKHDCVDGTFYEVDCKICSCYIENNVKHQICYCNPKCKNVTDKPKDPRPAIESMHGYCEPRHEYRKKCNFCTCLSDGKTIKCRSLKCLFSTIKRTLSVDVVPVNMKDDCPKGHSYKIDCNICYCLSNGNAICTTKECSSENV